MNRPSMTYAAMVMIFCIGLPLAAAELRVVATVPDLGDLVSEIGGERVRVSTLRARQRQSAFCQCAAQLCA